MRSVSVTTMAMLVPLVALAVAALVARAHMAGRVA